MSKALNGISGELYKARTEQEHFHSDIEIIFVIEGIVNVVVEGTEFILESEEILLINSSKPHYISVSGESIICDLTISYEMLTELLNEEYVAFWCSKLTARDPGYGEMLQIFREIIVLRLANEPRSSFRLLECYSRLLNRLVMDFKVDSSQWDQGGGDDAARVGYVINYIGLNYDEPVSLQNLADKLYVSASTLSRVFKKTTGMKFPDYVNQVRMQHAVKDMLNTNKSMTDIAVDNGFSSPSSFNRVFKDIYNTSPSQYKKTARDSKNSGSTVLTSDDESQIRNYLDNKAAAGRKKENQAVTDIYPENYTEYRKIANRAVTVGAFSQMSESVTQAQVKHMVETLGLEHVRLWNIFSPNCMIASAPDAKILSFEQIDIVLDFLIGIHVHPFLDMTTHDDCLIKSAKELIYRKNDSMGFKKLDQWAYFLEKFMEHVVFRYGSDEVSGWIFEFGNLPTVSSSCYYENDKYFKVFSTAYQIIKAHCPGAKVGGPDWVLDGHDIDYQTYIKEWEKEGVWPDFYTVFLFPYKTTGVNADHYGSSKVRIMDPDFMKEQILKVKDRLRELNMPDRPLVIAEISTILSNRNAMNDHCGRGTNTIRLANFFQKHADMVCFWVATDRLSLHYTPQGILHGGSGLLSKDGLPKPSFFALLFLNKLSSRCIGIGDDYVITENGSNGYYILCINHKNLNESYRYEEENAVNVLNVDQMFDDNSEKVLKFMLHGLEENGEYIVKRHVVNQEHGSIMDEWKRLAFEPDMRKNDIDYLRSICGPRIHMGHKTAEEGQMYLEADMKPHEIHLIHVYKAK
ncbi:MAG: helix-turn-helix domain-containing protein [Parasporobacterium sp.]|nr:helix-turn-helix domain-containing protein [Parasporobacterium sp.]